MRLLNLLLSGRASNTAPRLTSMDIVQNMLQMYIGEVNMMRAAVYDGISGPCLGCLSDVYTGYTGGVMGLPGPIQGATIEVALTNILQELVFAALPGKGLDASNILNTLCEYPLPGVKTVEQYLAGVNGCNKVTIKASTPFMNSIHQILSGMGCRCSKRLAEAVIAALVLRAEAYYPNGIPCDAIVEGRVDAAAQKITKEITWDELNYVIEYKVVPVKERGAASAPARGAASLV